MLVDQLYKKYSSQIVLGEQLEVLEYRQRDLFLQTNQREMHIDHLYLAAPAYACAHMFSRIDHLLVECLQKIRYAPLAVVGLVYHADEWIRPVKGFGYLKPSRERSPVLGTLFEDQIFEGRTPKDRHMFRVMIGGVRHPDILAKTQEQIIQMAQQELSQVLGLKTNPAHVFYQAWPHAIPQYDQLYVQTVAKLEERLKQHPPIQLLGNYLGGISFNDCITNAYQLAQNSQL